MAWISTGLKVLCSAVAFAVIAALNRYLKSVSIRSKGLKEPPGPPRRFLIGNLLDVPTKAFHQGYAVLAQTYGPVMQLVLPTQTIVVLSSAKAALDLLGKRGAAYSNRPQFPMLELMGWGWQFALRTQGEFWRVRRKILHTHLSAHAVVRYEGMQIRTALILAKNFINSPSQFREHIRWTMTANILQTGYGVEIAPHDDPLVEIADTAMDLIAKVFIPGKYAVDAFPLLKYVPSWFPGAEFQRVAKEGRKYSDGLLNAPFYRAIQAIEQGTAQPSIVGLSLSENTDEKWATVVKEAVGVMYFAGVDTTVSTVLAFIMEMVRYPEFQRKAHAELDRVIGSERLPTFADRQSLPYLEAILREVIRLYPVATMGIPHTTDTSDVYEGMYISKGSVVLANIWAILRDPEVYEDPHVFNPERFLKDGKINESVMDPRSAFFGFGRRVCVGEHFADTSLFIACVTVLACFNFSNAVEDGKEVLLSGEIDHQFVSTPYPFKCSIQVRSPKIEALVNMSLQSSE